MQEFFVKAHGGFYCGLCDPKNQEFFNTQSSKIIYSSNFCREMTINTLGPLLYLHNHFIEFSQLVVGYVGKCNLKGEFIVSEVIPSKMLKRIKKEKKELYINLEKCRDFRNETKWMTYCEHICKNFNLVRFQKFFIGDYKYFLRFVDYVKEREEIMVKSQQQVASINPDDIVNDPMSMVQRILDEEKTL